ncbi:MAG: hypothetical protein AAFY78_18215 [Cyanobacteria bacterium J06648_16]
MQSNDLARDYALLNLQPGASLSAINAAYFRHKARLIQQGQRAQIETLRTAWERIVADLQQPLADPTAAQPEADPQPAEQLLADALRQQGLTAQVSLQGTHLHLGLNVTEAPEPDPAMRVLRALLNPLDLPKLGLNDVTTVHVYGLSAPKQAEWREKFETAPLPPDDLDPFSFKNRFSNALYFPAALLVGILLQAFPLSHRLLWGIDVWFHEFGHATVAWLSGRRAIPLPLGFTPIDPARSVFVYGGVLILLGLMFWAGHREEKRWPRLLAVSLATLQFYMTWLMSPKMFDVLIYFGGIGGEFYICALLIVSFYFALPQYFQWGLYRYPVVVGAAFTFFGSLWNWRQVRRGLQDIPWGAMWGGDGDMEMLSAYGWSNQRIIDTYNHLGSLCLSVVIGVYVYTVLKQHHRWLAGQWEQWQTAWSRS